MKIEDLGLTPALRSKIGRHFTSVDELITHGARELRALPGIGPVAVADVIAALATKGLLLAGDPYEPYHCAREGRPAGDAALTDLWLCDECAHQFQSVAFGGTAPEWVSPPLGGYCVNCVEPQPSVRLRQWFLCGVCGRVARSFGRSIVAARRLLELWADVIQPETGVELEEIDHPVLRRRDAQTISSKVATIDFVGTRQGRRLFGFEMKVGPGGIGRGAVRPMAEFQLDCSDCDDIITAAGRDRLPVYLLHAQVLSRAAPPTPRFVAVDFWWADPFSMAEHFKRTQTRSRETRMAAYYHPAMFSPIRGFAQHIRESGPETLQRRIKRQGLPRLYAQ